jgi:hypothetical protein
VTLNEEERQQVLDRWGECISPEAMLEVLGKRASNRKLRLFACACVRRVAWLLRGEPDALAAIDCAERYADRQINKEQWEAARDSLKELRRRARAAVAFRAEFEDAVEAAVALSLRRAEAAALRAYLYMAQVEARTEECPVRGLDVDADTGVALARAWRYFSAVRAGEAHAGLLRCVLGNPFRPVAAEAGWRTPDVVRRRKPSTSGAARTAAIWSVPAWPFSRTPWRRPAAWRRLSWATCAARARTSAVVSRWTCAWPGAETSRARLANDKSGQWGCPLLSRCRQGSHAGQRRRFGSPCYRAAHPDLQTQARPPGMLARGTPGLPVYDVGGQ